MEPLSARALKFAILATLESGAGRKQHKMNMLGRHSGGGALESHLRRVFTPEDRAQADRAFEELRTDGLLRATYDDLNSPEQWVVITDAGRRALERHALDDLDFALLGIGPGLVELRDGAWAAVSSARPDALRQAAHSGRELIEQTLRNGAPDNEVRAEPGFVADKSSKSGITRRQRIRYIMNRRCGGVSDTDLRVIEKACDLVVAVNDRLIGFAHASQVPPVTDVEDSLLCAEIALRRVLVDSAGVQHAHPADCGAS